MAKLVSSVITTLDGFASGPNGEIDMFKVNDEFFDLSNKLTEEADTALYGRGTYQIMNNYWPRAANQPNASAHDKEHSAWYNRVEKIVLSTTLKNITDPKTKILSTDISREIAKLKQQKEKNIQIFGSPGVVSSLTQLNLIDEYWIFIAPVIIGHGKPLFNNFKNRANLKLLSCKAFSSGILAVHYQQA